MNLELAEGTGANNLHRAWGCTYVDDAGLGMVVQRRKETLTTSIKLQGENQEDPAQKLE